IGFYGDNMGKFVPNYLEQAFNDFTQKQDQFRDQLNKSFGGMFPMSSFEEMSKQNMAMFEQTMKAFSNFAGQNKTHKED
ncbi:MAG TPA: polyhydroxyalkanoate synthesis repressor PhaR, partial [Alphaproteobacteria bacterium]|nr:polyhydroxyalkanoate synthesis repressor PhaR [Alphaproteobacteria bacterium]